MPNPLVDRRVVIGVLLLLFHTTSYAKDALAIIKEAIDHERDASSYAVMEMTIHRSDWQRTMTMQIWTQGMEKSLMRVVSPKKDAGNGTLLIEDDMWTYAPKINRVIKLPSSMMNQSWMGSDFSNNDVARSDDLIDKYDHRVVSQEVSDGRTTYAIESVPHEDAPVVWGKEVVLIRDDHLVLEHRFFDQDGVLVKRMKALDIATIGGKTIVSRLRMQKVDTPNEWTEIHVKEAKYGIAVPSHTFTMSNLRNPRL